jgi:hypothetical protein
MKKQKYLMFRQGDVLLVDASYRGDMKSGKDITPESRVILMHGEATGHAHAIEDFQKVRYFDVGAERFLRALVKTPLTHEEHLPIPLSPDDAAGGKYQQAFQVEDYGVEVRRVID